MDDLLWARRWKRVLTYLKAGLLVTAIGAVGCAGYAAYEASFAIRDSRTVMGEAIALTVSANARFESVQGDLHGTSQNVNAILLQAGLAADQARLASRDQREYARRFDAKLSAIADSADVAIRSASADIHQSTLDVHEVLKDMPATVTGINDMVTTSNRMLSDPNIGGSFNAIRLTAERSMSAMSHIDAIASNVEKMSDDAQGSFHKTMHPTRWQVARGSMLTGLKLLVSAKPW